MRDLRGVADSRPALSRTARLGAVGAVAPDASASAGECGIQRLSRAGRSELFPIGRSKTQAGLREIPLLPALRDELATHKARATRTGPDDPVFPTSGGGVRDKDNLRNRILAAAITRADGLLAQRQQTPLPNGVTPHKLRHTFASILVACGEDLASVMAQLGHTDPKFTLRVYTHLMRRDPTERARLKALVHGVPIDPHVEVATHVATPEPRGSEAP
jgi:integrase